MPTRTYITVSDISICLATDHPLKESKAFLPFLTEETEPDIEAVFSATDSLPPLPHSPLFTDRAYRIGRDAAGNPQKFFFEIPEDPVHYAVSTFDAAHGKIRVDYRPEYVRCVSELSNSFYHLGFEAILLQRNRLCLHASCVRTHLGGLLFSGVSGIGKSTQAELWCSTRGAEQINGDRPILSCDDGRWLAWGSPYAGSSKYHVNASCPITAIVLLAQADTCTVRRLSPAQAFRGLWPGMTVHSWDPDFVAQASALTAGLAADIPVYALSCTPDERAVTSLEDALAKEGRI